MIVYHGSNILYGPEIYCPSIFNELHRGKDIMTAYKKAQIMLEKLNNFDDTFSLQRALDDAQTTSDNSPFISTSQKRDVARQFATTKNGQGYIYTIEGPEKEFYNFNEIRSSCNLPQHKTFNWMGELGIPFEIKLPFEIVQIEKIIEIKEITELIYQK
ncbi:MAG: hypothetical protein ABIN95_12860 [Mucilaginibacter sp.]